MSLQETNVIPAGLVETLRRIQSITVLTGAGISQESGLSTFRDAQNGLWAKYRPEELATPEAFLRDPRLVWDWYAMRRERIKSALPNLGHNALVELQRRIPKFTLITQNVDGLHQKAGSVGVIELHGNIHRVKCSVCGELSEQWDDLEGEVPRCRACDGLLRPDVVWFGEKLPKIALELAVRASRRCNAFLSIGTSGLVQPAASLAHTAMIHGAVLVEINLTATPLTPNTDYFLAGKSGELLPQLVQSVWG
jgi:NAD-dependent deacetylase